MIAKESRIQDSSQGPSHSFRDKVRNDSGVDARDDSEKEKSYTYGTKLLYLG